MDKDKAKKRWDAMTKREAEIAADETITHADARAELAEIADMRGLLRPILGIKDEGEKPVEKPKAKRSWL